jgi:CubicO group peptidase (beta-lactamase class C family)
MSLSKARLVRMHDVMAGHVSRGDMPGLVTVIDRHGETHVDTIGTMAIGGDEPMRRDAIFRIASLTKPIIAVATMILVEECVVRLDDPVDPLLPELADRRVLRSLDGPIDDTVPAHRAITLRDLLTFRMGFGLLMAPPDTYPIQKAIASAGLAPGPNPVAYTPDEWMANLGSLPLIAQPGERWMYHTGSDVLGVLIARATGQTLEEFLRERIFEPLGMPDTGFHVPASELHRLPPSYQTDGDTLTVHDDPRDSAWAAPPSFPQGGGGLVSTADDYLAFCRMMLAKGRYADGRILSRPSVELMTSDQLTPPQKIGSFFGESESWGFGVGVTTRRDDLSASPGRFGWTGGTGTTCYSDPAEDLVGILLTQRLMVSPEPPAVFRDFWTSTYQAIDD